MEQYEIIVRRHEKTMPSPNNDTITQEGFGLAYKRGMEYRAKNQGAIFDVFASSGAQRTVTTAYAWMAGLGISPAHLRKDDRLFFNLPNEKKQAIRILKDPAEQYKLLFDDPLVQPYVEESGRSLANYVVGMLNTPRMPEHAFRDVTIHNGPPINAGYLILTGKPVNYESLISSSGIFNEGEGFDVMLRKDGSLSIVEIAIEIPSIKKTEEFSLEEITQRLKRTKR
jgi:hypothetical protein